SVEQNLDTPYYFYNVPAPSRFLTPEARDCLLLVTARFQENLKRRVPDAPLVKLAVSSAVRSVSYQKGLRERNANASFASSHSFGISFDLFYDDFFVALPLPAAANATSQKILADLRPRVGYLMGDALASQFRSVLLETLYQLQTEGKLYAILEKNQRCYHVTVVHK
ncbi:MAG: hypothetical protein HY042_09355, partial [Spirochaetia bacterium]|nr:hypothetical protein [Spirochaetia bacterium]